MFAVPLRRSWAIMYSKSQPVFYNPENCNSQGVAPWFKRCGAGVTLWLRAKHESTCKAVCPQCGASSGETRATLLLLLSLLLLLLP